LKKLHISFHEHKEWQYASSGAAFQVWRVYSPGLNSFYILRRIPNDGWTEEWSLNWNPRGAAPIEVVQDFADAKAKARMHMKLAEARASLGAPNRGADYSMLNKWIEDLR